MVTQFPLAVLAHHTKLPEGQEHPEGIARLELMRSPPAQAAQPVCVCVRGSCYRAAAEGRKLLRHTDVIA